MAHRKRRHQTKEQLAEVRRCCARGKWTPEYSACARKRRYGSRESARQAALKCKRSHGLDHDLWAYKCPWCRGWHITKRPHGDEAPVATADAPTWEAA